MILCEVGPAQHFGCHKLAAGNLLSRRCPAMRHILGNKTVQGMVNIEATHTYEILRICHGVTVEQVLQTSCMITPT